MSAVAFTAFSSGSAYAEGANDTSRIIHVYFLTGQSNSLGTVRINPAPQELRDLYATTQDEAMLWNGNMKKSDGTLYEPEATRVWKAVVPQAPTFNGNLCMGPEYGFAYMMEKKGWDTATVNGVDHDIAIVKCSLDGGENAYWVKGTAAYNSIVNSIKTAVGQLPEGAQIDVSGLMYLQGESDRANTADITEAKQRYLNFLTNLSGDLKAAGINADAILTDSVVGEPANWKGNDNTSGGTTTAKELLALSKENENVDYVYTRDMTKITGGDDLGVHYDGKSQLTIGARYAYATAIQKGLNVSADGRVRSQQYGDTQLNETPVSLNEARAWWRNADETAWSTTALANEVVVWDLSSANQEDTLNGNLAVKGIRVEDPFRDTVVIKNAGSADATLSVGEAGIQLQRSNLSLQTKVATTADQTWDIAAGRTLNISNALSGNHTIALQNSTGSGTGSVVLSRTDTDHSWSLGNGTSLAGTALGNVAVQAGASAALSADSVATLTMSNNTTLAVGGEGDTAALNIGTLTLQGDTTFVLDFKSSAAYDSLTVSHMAGTGSAVFDFNIGRTGRGGNYTVVSGWDNTYTFSATGLGAGSSLNLVNGNLVLTLAGSSSAPDYSKTWPKDTQTQGSVTSGTFDAAASSANGLFSGSTSYFFASANNRGSEAEPINVYAEAHNINATWVAAAGETGASRYRTMTGNVSLLVSGDTDGSAHNTTAAFSIANATVHGDVYTELADANATYTGATYGSHSYASFGVYNGIVDGNNTLVIRDGVFNNAVTAGASAWSNGQSIGAVQLDIKGGTFKNRISAAGTGLVNGNVDLVISGGDFSQNSNGIYAGGNAATSIVKGDTITTLAGIDGNNAFAAYNGTVSGGGAVTGATVEGNRILCLSGVQTNLNATLKDFNVINVTDATETTLKHSKIVMENGTQVTVDGESRLALQKDGAGPWKLGDANVTFSVAQDSVLSKVGDYWVNLGKLTGQGTYEIAGTSGGSQVANLSGFSGTISVATGNSLQLLGTDGANTTFRVAQGGTAALTAATGAMGTLSGNGQVIFYNNSKITQGAGGTGFSFADDWTGTVKLTKENIATANNQQIFLSKFGQAGSVIELSGVGKGNTNLVYLASETVNADLKLTGDGLTLGAGSSGTFTTFNGAWSGNGAFSFTYGNTTQGFRFNGDMTGYTGNMTFAGKQVVEFGNGGIGASVGSISGTGVLNATGATATLRFNYSGDVNAKNLIQGNFNLEQNGSASLTLTAANTYTGTTTINSGSVILKENGALGTGTVTLKAAGHASLTAGGITITTNETDVLISGQQQGGISAAGLNGSFTLTNAVVTADNTADTTLGTKLQQSTLINSGSGTVTVNHSDNTLTRLYAKNGAITVQNAESTAAALKDITAEGGNITLVSGTDSLAFTLNTLTLANGRTVSAYVGGSALTQSASDPVANLYIADGGHLITGTAAHLDANLVIGNGATVSMAAGGLDMGCTVTLGAGEHFELSGATVNNGVLENYVLFTGVEGLTLNGTAITDMGWYDATAIIAGITANGVTLDTTEHSYVIGYWNGTVSLAESTVPEPATATLSLLALAALAARRRR